MSIKMIYTFVRNKNGVLTVLICVLVNLLMFVVSIDKLKGESALHLPSHMDGVIATTDFLFL